MPSRHHLELQGEESELFMSHFPHGIKLMHGGVESGFKHVPPKVHEPTLLRVVGSRYPRIFPVPLEVKQLTEGDCFILDLGDNIYAWYGEQSNNYERLAAMNYAVDLKNHMRMMTAKLHYPRTMGGQIEADFYAALSGSKSDVQPAFKDEKNPEVSDDVFLKYRLWHIWENDQGKIEGKEVEERPLRVEMLKDDDTFILELYN